MEIEKAKEYRKTLTDVLKSEPDKASRREFLNSEKLTEQYIDSRKITLEQRQLLKGLRGDEYQLVTSEASSKNPLAEISFNESSMDEEERDILWANRVLAELKESSTYQDRNQSREIMKHASRRMLKKPESIGRIAAVFRSDSNSDQVDSTYNQIRERVVKDMRSDWAELSVDQIAGLIKTYSNDELVRDFNSDLLKAYFKGPTSRNQRVDAYYNFVFASLDVIDDPKAVDEVVKIGYFETEIIPRESEFHIDLMSARNSLDDDNLLRKSMVADHAVFNLSFISTVDVSEARERNAKVVNTNERIERELLKSFNRAKKKYGEVEVRKRIAAMEQFNGTSNLVVGEDALRIMKEWPHKLAVGDPLTKKQDELLGSLVVAKRIKRESAEQIRRGEYTDFKDAVQVSVVSPQGYIIDVFIPSLYLDKKDEIVKDVMKSGFLSEEEQMQIGNSPSGEQVEVIARRISSISGTEHASYICWYRRQSKIENLHPVNTLSEIGVPFGLENKSEDVGLLSNVLASQIERTQVRFLNKRGVQINLEFPEFKRLGYESIVFKAGEGSKTSVEINVLGSSYKIKLDGNFNFDLEGKRIDSPLLSDSLRLLVLRMLRPVLCDINIQDKVKGADKDEKEILSRMGHLRLLPDGFKFTDRAVVNFFRERGKDLHVKNAERQIELKTNRNTTYVSEVKEKAENLPPVVIELLSEVFRI